LLDISLTVHHELTIY